MEVGEVGLCRAVFESSRVSCGALQKIIAVIVLVIHVSRLSLLVMLHREARMRIYVCTCANGAATITRDFLFHPGIAFTLGALLLCHKV